MLWLLATAQLQRWSCGLSSAHKFNTMVLKAEATAKLHVIDYLELLCLQPIWPESSCCSAVYKVLCRRHDI